MQGSKQDSFVKSQKQSRRWDDGVGKQSNTKKFQKSKRPKQHSESQH